MSRLFATLVFTSLDSAARCFAGLFDSPDSLEMLQYRAEIITGTSPVSSETTGDAGIAREFPRRFGLPPEKSVGLFQHKTEFSRAQLDAAGRQHIGCDGDPDCELRVQSETDDEALRQFLLGRHQQDAQGVDNTSEQSAPVQSTKSDAVGASVLQQERLANQNAISDAKDMASVEIHRAKVNFCRSMLVESNPFAWGPGSGMRFRSVDGGHIDLFVTKLTAQSAENAESSRGATELNATVKSSDAHRASSTNGQTEISSSFGQIGLRCGENATFDFRFMNSSSELPVKMSRFHLSIADVGQGVAVGCKQSVNITGYADDAISKSMFFTANPNEGHFDADSTTNIRMPNAEDDDRSFSFVFTNTESFTVNFYTDTDQNQASPEKQELRKMMCGGVTSTEPAATWLAPPAPPQRALIGSDVSAEAGCQMWCYNHKKSWAAKCSWESKMCSGCFPCLQETESPTERRGALKLKVEPGQAWDHDTELHRPRSWQVKKTRKPDTNVEQQPSQVATVDPDLAKQLVQTQLTKANDVDISGDIGSFEEGNHTKKHRRSAARKRQLRRKRREARNLACDDYCHLHQDSWATKCQWANLVCSACSDCGESVADPQSLLERNPTPPRRSLKALLTNRSSPAAMSRPTRFMDDKYSLKLLEVRAGTKHARTSMAPKRKAQTKDVDELHKIWSMLDDQPVAESLGAQVTGFCRPYCSDHTKDWDTKCAWKSRDCSACSPCPVQVQTAPSGEQQLYDTEALASLMDDDPPGNLEADEETLESAGDFHSTEDESTVDGRGVLTALKLSGEADEDPWDTLKKMVDEDAKNQQVDVDEQENHWKWQGLETFAGQQVESDDTVGQIKAEHLSEMRKRLGDSLQQVKGVDRREGHTGSEIWKLLAGSDPYPVDKVKIPEHLQPLTNAELSNLLAKSHADSNEKVKDWWSHLATPYTSDEEPKTPRKIVITSDKSESEDEDEEAEEDIGRRRRALHLKTTVTTTTIDEEDPEMETSEESTLRRRRSKTKTVTSSSKYDEEAETEKATESIGRRRRASTSKKSVADKDKKDAAEEDQRKTKAGHTDLAAELKKLSQAIQSAPAVELLRNPPAKADDSDEDDEEEKKEDDDDEDADKDEGDDEPKGKVKHGGGKKEEDEDEEEDFVKMMEEDAKGSKGKVKNGGGKKEEDEDDEEEFVKMMEEDAKGSKVQSSRKSAAGVEHETQDEETGRRRRRETAKKTVSTSEKDEAWAEKQDEAVGRRRRAATAEKTAKTKETKEDEEENIEKKMADDAEGTEAKKDAAEKEEADSEDDFAKMMEEDEEDSEAKHDDAKEGDADSEDDFAKMMAEDDEEPEAETKDTKDRGADSEDDLAKLMAEDAGEPEVAETTKPSMGEDDDEDEGEEMVEYEDVEDSESIAREKELEKADPDLAATRAEMKRLLKELEDKEDKDADITDKSSSGSSVFSKAMRLFSDKGKPIELKRIEGSHACQQCTDGCVVNRVCYKGKAVNFKVCNSFRDDYPSAYWCPQASKKAVDRCADFDAPHSCAWTKNYNCPGQRPLGQHGRVARDSSLAYSCCCKKGLWHQEWTATSLLSMQPTSALGVQLRPQEKTTFTEEEYQAVVALKNDTAFSEWVKGVLESENKMIVPKQDSELDGFVPWFSGSMAVQTLKQMLVEIADKPWVQEVVAK